MAYIYLLECSDGTFYTGATVSLTKRLIKHSAGKGSKYTRGRLPVKLAYFELCDSYSKALQEEYKLKSKDRQYKQHLALHFANTNIKQYT